MPRLAVSSTGRGRRRLRCGGHHGASGPYLTCHLSTLPKLKVDRLQPTTLQTYPLRLRNVRSSAYDLSYFLPFLSDVFSSGSHEPDFHNYALLSSRYHRGSQTTRTGSARVTRIPEMVPPYALSRFESMAPWLLVSRRCDLAQVQIDS